MKTMEVGLKPQQLCLLKFLGNVKSIDGVSNLNILLSQMFSENEKLGEGPKLECFVHYSNF